MSFKNVIVVGGSYVGINAAQTLQQALKPPYRVLLCEPHSHFQHLFAFPRFAVVPGYEHKAFIPYKGIFSNMVRARVQKITSPSTLLLDRPFEGSKELSFEYLVLATGTKLQEPFSIAHEEKLDGVNIFKAYQAKIKAAQKVTILGAGAVGVQLAFDLKQYYPDKDVTLVHSRDFTMPRFDRRLHDNFVKPRAEELGVKLVKGRAILPPEGFPQDNSDFEVKLENGSSIPSQFAVIATGQVPATDYIAHLDVISPENGFINIRPSLQIAKEGYDNIFAVGDIANTKNAKAARPAMPNVNTVKNNIVALIEGKELEDHTTQPAGIHLTLGLTRSVKFRNPSSADEEPWTLLEEDGSEDMGINGVWNRRGATVSQDSDYHL